MPVRPGYGKELALFWRMNPTSLKPFGLRGTTRTTRSNKPASGQHFPAFYKFCSNVGAELSRDYVVEFTAFTIIAVISAWPILFCIAAISHMLRFS
jgi:hypothetical protein